jgi:uncharacterized Ntn-hydrolase superfamily protein
MSFPESLASTFSILGFDPDALEWGVAVQSKAFVVGGSVPWAQAGVGAIATQAWTNKSFGARGLGLLKNGHDPKDVIQHLIASDPGGAQRQLGVMDARGRAANYTGDECINWAGGIAEQNVSVQGNLLAGERVLKNMLRAFNQARGKLGERLIAALEAGQKAGGDTRGAASGQKSAALLVVREKSDIDGVGDVYVDLRVDDHKTPIAELRRLYGIWEQEMYPFLEGQRIQALLKAKKYARAQKLHRDFAANAERLAKRNWQDAALLNALAWQFAQNAFGLDAAYKYAQRAVKLKPRDENIADTFAQVLYQRGDTARAVEIERALVAKHPDRADLKQQMEKFEKAFGATQRHAKA